MYGSDLGCFWPPEVVLEGRFRPTADTELERKAGSVFSVGIIVWCGKVDIFCGSVVTAQSQLSGQFPAL